MIERKPTSAVLLSLLALLASGCGSLGADQPALYDREGARGQYRDMMESQLLGPPSAESKLAEGDRHHRRGDLQRAVLAYFESARLEPENIVARLRLAHVVLQVNPERAMLEFDKLLKEAPEHAGPIFGIGLAHLAIGELPQARSALERAVTLDPDSPAIRSALGSVYDRMGDHERARGMFDVAALQAPDEPRVLNNRGVSMLLDHDPAKAEPVLRRAVLLDPDNPVTRNNLGLALGLQGRYDDALQTFRKVGDEQAARNNLGYVYYLQGEHEQAIATYERALLEGGTHAATIVQNLKLAEAALERAGSAAPR